MGCPQLDRAGPTLLLPSCCLALPGGQPHEAPGRQGVQVQGGGGRGGEVRHPGGHLHGSSTEQIQQILLCFPRL